MKRLQPWRFHTLFQCIAGCMMAAAGCTAPAPSLPGERAAVGAHPAATVLPVSQLLTPAGLQVDLPGLRPQAVALRRDGRILLVSGQTAELLVIDPGSGKILQRVALPAEKSTGESADGTAAGPGVDGDGQLSYTGLVFARDGRRAYLSNVNGSIKRFTVDGDGRVAPLDAIALPGSGRRSHPRAIPSGLVLSEDGRRLYVTLNLSNRLAEVDLATGKVTRLFAVGVAPFDVRVVGSIAFVSNWGGRRPTAKSVTGPAGRGTRVRVDPVRFIASEGSVSVIDLHRGTNLREILVGRHASALALTPDERYLAVANAAQDTISVIDTARREVAETVSVSARSGDLFGATPNALAFDATGRRLYVCNGTENAVAVLAFEPPRSHLLGRIPVGWFPGAIAFDGVRKRLDVANIKGIGPPESDAESGVSRFNSRQYHGTLSLVPLPTDRELRNHTAVVVRNLGRRTIEAARLPPRPGIAPRPVPERAGEPSVFHHVLYIIKENRTYDQVLGDMARGNGAAELCVFGREVTPNQHALAHQFVLLDNTYCSGILSADGHQWSDSAFATDYMERSFAGFPRSYPDGMLADDVDALAYAPSGFIWDAALAHRLSLRMFGEFAITRKSWIDPAHRGGITFLDHYRDFLHKGGRIRVGSRPSIESLRGFSCPSMPGWDLDIPDVQRADIFIRELHGAETQGSWPELMIFSLPNDHTSGTREGSPTPAAQVADNDLALGRIVDAVSHTSFWPETCIFVIEDDPQAGWDHVSGYRTTAYVVSPYTPRSRVVSTRYNQPGILRTIELILGLPPMNRMDAAARPLRACFQAEPDFTPFRAQQALVPLDLMNPAATTLNDPALRQDALESAALPLEQADRCDEDLLNRILWRARRGAREPYPDWAVLPRDLRASRAPRGEDGDD